MGRMFEEAVRDEARLRAALAEADIAHSGVTSWYKNRRNRVTVASPWRASPWRLLDYRKLTRHSLPEDYRAGRPGHGAVIPGQEAQAVSSIERPTVG
jgi:4-hydroxyacetophenone monooxygenase